MSEIVIQGTTPGIRVSGTGAQVTVKVTTGSGGGGGGVTDHNALSGRSDPDQHPIGAVTGLQGALDGKVSTSDPRLSDARTPTAHKVSHATGGTDPLTPADIGAAEETHAHAAADVTSGVIAPARLGTGTADATTVLHGDGTWGAGGGPVFPLFADVPIGQYTPVYSVGAYVDFAYWSYTFLTPVIAPNPMTVDRVAVQVWTAVAGATIATVLYAWSGSVATKIATLGNIPASPAALQEISFAPIELPAGVYIIASRSNGGNPVTSGLNGPALGLKQGSPGSNSTGLWGAELLKTGGVDVATFGGPDIVAGRQTPRIVLRRSA